MTTINSVLGPLDTDSLGFTLMHEHLVVAAAGVHVRYPELFGDDLLGQAVGALKAARQGGVRTIVDATTPDLGRDVVLLAEASRLSGVNIIACTGWWLDVPPAFAGLSVDQLAGIFAREIEEGIWGTGIKAGVLKCAADVPGVTPELEKVLRAVARAHRRTAAPIMLHSHSPGQVGRRQLAILKEEGVDLSRVKLDHSNDTTDLDYLAWLLQQGCYLGLDRYPGRTLTPPARTQTMKALIDMGYGGRICPSHDWPIALMMLSSNAPAMEERRKLNPHAYLYVSRVVFPMLREMGVSEGAIAGLCVDGPRGFLAGSKVLG